MNIYLIDPCSKPRMTQSDKWKKRTCVTKYFNFKDEVNSAGITLNDSGDEITFVVPMPKSWSKKKKKAMRGQPHQQRPDIDNYLKALFDAVRGEDCTIWHCTPMKVWGNVGGIVVI